MLSNMFLLWYLAYVQPLIGRLLNRLEIFNFYLFGVIVIVSICFTDWMASDTDQEKQMKLDIAWVLVILTSYMCSVNIMLVLYYAFHDATLLFRRYANRHC